jgi:hypothetical protein
VAQREVHAEGPDAGAECQSEEQLGKQVAAVELEELARRPQHLQRVAGLEERRPGLGAQRRHQERDRAGDEQHRQDDQCGRGEPAELVLADRQAEVDVGDEEHQEKQDDLRDELRHGVDHSRRERGGGRHPESLEEPGRQGDTARRAWYREVDVAARELHERRRAQGQRLRGRAGGADGVGDAWELPDHERGTEPPPIGVAESPHERPEVDVGEHPDERVRRDDQQQQAEQ